MNLEVLKNLGFTRIEIAIYIDLVKHGESSATEIANRINISRTYVYDAIEHLIKKGIISYVLKNNRKRFKPLDYSKLIDFIENKKKHLDEQKKEVANLITEFKKYSKINKEVPQVEVLEGSEGLKTILNDIVAEKKNAVAWGATDRIRDYVPDWFIDRYINEKSKKGIMTTQLYAEGGEPLKGKGYNNKAISQKYSSPVTFSSYGNKTAIFFWSEIPIVIRIQNKEIAKSFEKHFNILWKTARKK